MIGPQRNSHHNFKSCIPFLDFGMFVLLFKENKGIRADMLQCEVIAYRWRVEVERNKPYCMPRSAGVGRRNSRSNCGRKRDISWRSSRRIQKLGRCRPPRRNGGDSTKSRLSAGPAARLREGVGRRPIAAKSAPEFRNSWPKRSGSASRPTWTCKWIERERRENVGTSVTAGQAKRFPASQKKNKFQSLYDGPIQI